MGTVKWFNAEKGFGFIRPQEQGKDVFVHMTTVEKAGLSGLNEGQKVQFKIGKSPGAISAVSKLKLA